MKLHRVAALLLKYWYVTRNSVDRILDIIFWPVVDLLVWGFTAVFVTHLAKGTPVLGFFIGGLMLWTLFDRSQKDVSVYILQDFWDKSVYNMYVSPVKESELFVSVMLLGLVRSLLSFGIMVALAASAYAFNLLSLGFVQLTLFMIPLLLFGWGIGILIAGIVFRLGARVSILTWSLPFLLQPIATIFYPAEVLPSWLQALASLFPLVHVFEGFRAALQGSFAVEPFITATILSLLSIVLGYGVFLWCVKRSKETGFLSKQ